MADGTNSSPGAFFASDTNTGFHRPSSDTIGFSIGGSEEFRMASDGSFHADADIIAYSTTIASDRRLKKNINPLKYGLSELLKLNPVSYDWKLNDRPSDIGIIAQDVMEVIPELVTSQETIGNTHKFLTENYPDDEPVRYTVDYAKLSVILINSVKEQQKQIEELSTRLKELENNV